MLRNKAARSSGSYSRAIVHSGRDVAIIPRDVLLGVAGALVMVGVPFILAALKQFGWW